MEREWQYVYSTCTVHVLPQFPCFTDPRIVYKYLFLFFKHLCGLVHPYLYIADDKCILPVEWTAEGGNECQVVKLQNLPLQVRTFGAQKLVKSNCP